MSEYLRYAIYLAPPAGSPLAAFGAAWLGWDGARGKPVTQLAPKGLPAPIEAIAAAPRRYGFHGTLKPPFRLAAGTDEAELVKAVRRFAHATTGFEIGALRLARIGRFLALEPTAAPPALTDLACDAVRVLDAFRAPMTPGEIERRWHPGLTPAQEALLAQWGYPYVMAEFRFHLTLTGPLEPEALSPVESVLAGELAPLLDVPLPVRDICLFAERTDGYFEILERFPLAAAQTAAAS